MEETTDFPELRSSSPTATGLTLASIRASVPKLGRLIQIKQGPGRPKDQPMLPLLLATLDEANRSKSSPSTLPPTHQKPIRRLAFQLWRTRVDEFRTALRVVA